MSRDYNASNIKALKGSEAVRKRPAMYIGNTAAEGLHHLIWEITDNSIDEYLAGYCNKISVIIHEDETVTVIDNGRGIPVDMHKDGIPAVTLALTTLHAGGKFGGDNSSYSVAGGLHGVGSSVVNFLSEKLGVIVKKDGKIHQQLFKKGEIVTDLKTTGTCDKKDTGTTIKFKFDPAIFSVNKYEYRIVKRRLKELAFLNPGLEIIFKDLREKTNEIFKFDGGISEYIKYLNCDKELFTKPVYLKYSHKTPEARFDCEVAFIYNIKWSSIICSYANNVNTHEGGVHFNASLDSLNKAIQKFSEKNKYFKGMRKDIKIQKSDISEGLVMITNIKITEPEFEGQTKTKLGNSGVRNPLGNWLEENIYKYFEEHKDVAKSICDKIVESVKTRETVRKMKDTLRTKPKSRINMTLVGKLVPCVSRKPEECELYLVEGQSALGTAKSARDKHTQAVLPLKGKVINAMKSDLNDILKNDEIKSIIASLKIELKRKNGQIECDISKLRYHKIIPLCHTGDTRVPLLNGKTYTIEQLAKGVAGQKFWIYSYDLKTRKMIPKLAHSARKTQEVKEIIEIKWDDGTKNRCTLDHHWILNDGTEIKAKDLKSGDSMLSIYRKISPGGYEKFYEESENPNKKNKWINTHTRIAQIIYPKELNLCKNNSCKQMDQNNRDKTKTKLHIHPVIHHININKRDNTPENLEWQTSQDHFTIHSKHETFIFTMYNKSSKHRERIKELHQQGHYKDYTWKDTYNGSEKHINDIKKDFEDPIKREKMLKGLFEYNGSELNSITATKRNKKIWKDPNIREKMVKNKVLNILNPIVKNIKSFKKSLEEIKIKYEETRAKNTMKFKNIIEKYGIGIIEEAKYYNHKIVSIKRIKLQNPIQMYNLTVPDTHLFMLENGVITRNCDADVDGGHIESLILSFFYRCAPELIEKGYIYISQPPLYKIVYKNKIRYLKDDDELKVFKENNPDFDPIKHSNHIQQRFKGLGEMNPDQLEDTTMNPHTRSLKRIIVKDTKEMDTMFNTLMGHDLESRKKYIMKYLKTVDDEFLV